MASTLVKTLLETKQVIPDFLESWIPKGFTAAGEGDADLLKFDSDIDGEGGGDDAWGAATAADDAPANEPASPATSASPPASPEPGPASSAVRGRGATKQFPDANLKVKKPEFDNHDTWGGAKAKKPAHAPISKHKAKKVEPESEDDDTWGASAGGGW